MTSSRASDVVRAPRSPQGTIRSNDSRSVVTLSAKPWMATRDRTWTPKAHSFSSFVHRPGASRRNVVATPSSASNATHGAGHRR